MTNENHQASGLDFLKRLRHRWRLAGGLFAAVFLAGAAVILLLPNKYQAELKVAVKNERVDPMMGSDKQTQGILYVNDVSEPRINTEIELMTSSKVLGQVVERCHLGSLVKLRGRPESSRKEAALRMLERDLKVDPVRNSNVIQVTYESTDPHRAADVVSALWQFYSSASRVMHGVPGSLAFFERLSSNYDDQLADAQKDLEQFRKSHRVVSLPEELTLSLANASHVSSQIADSSAAAERSAAAAARLDREIHSMPASVERDRRSIPNHALTQQLTSLLVTLQNKYTETSARYQSGDRLLTELDAQIARTEAQLAQANRTTSDEVSVAANPAMDVARSEYVRSTAETAGARAQTAELARQLDKDRANLAMLTAESATYKQLTQRVAEMEELDETYHKKTEEARLEQSLDEQRISNLALLDEPFVPALPHSPKRGLLLTLDLLWSLLIAFLAAAIAEMMSKRIHSPFQLGQATGLPLLAILPARTPAPRFSSFPALYLSMQRRVPVLTEDQA